MKYKYEQMTIFLKDRHYTRERNEKKTFLYHPVNHRVQSKSYTRFY